MRFKVVLSEEANDDLSEYIRFIKDVYKAPMTAEKHYVEIFELLRKLENFAQVSAPARQKSLLNKYGLGVRRINYKNMAIIYTIHSNIVYVRRIMPQSLITNYEK